MYCLALALLVAAAFIDLDTTLLPDDLTLPLIGLGLVAAWLKWTPVSLPDAALGAFFGYFSLWFVAFAYKLVRGVQGMAEGDFKLLAGLGALLGWQALPSDHPAVVGGGRGGRHLHDRGARPRPQRADPVRALPGRRRRLRAVLRRPAQRSCWPAPAEQRHPQPSA